MNFNLNVPVIEITLFMETITCLIESIIKNSWNSLVDPMKDYKQLIYLLSRQTIDSISFYLNEVNHEHIECNRYYFKFNEISTEEWGENYYYMFGESRHKAMNCNLAEIGCYLDGGIKDLAIQLHLLGKELPFMTMFSEYTQRKIMTIDEWKIFLADQDVDKTKNIVWINLD